jgi:hypothetical protein
MNLHFWFVFELRFCAAAAEAEDLDYRLREIESLRDVRRQAFEIDEITFDVLHRLAARAHQVMMRIEIAVHTQGGSVWRDFAKQSVLHEETKIVVDRSQRNGWKTLAHGGVDLLRGAVTVRGDDHLVNHLALMRGSEAMLPREFPKVFV